MTLDKIYAKIVSMILLSRYVCRATKKARDFGGGRFYFKFFAYLIAKSY